MPVETSIRRFEYIDALRGWAFLAVLVIHAAHEAAPGRLLGHLTWRGQYGVQLFYVLSALTLFLSMHSRWKKDKRPLAAFFIRRFFRIAPMFWLAIVFYLFLDGFGPGYWAPDGITAGMVAATAAFVHGWNPVTINSVVPGGWSIAVEMSFYLLLPLLFVTIRSGRQAALFCLLAFVFGVALRHWMLPVLAARYPPAQFYLVEAFLYLWLPAQLPVFGVGLAVYFFLKGKPSLSPWLFLGAAFAVGSVGTFLKGEWLPVHDILAVSFGLLACGLAQRPVFLLVNPLMRHAGKVSYSAYLTHFALVHPCDLLVGRLQGPAHFLLLLAVVFIVTLAVSTVTYHLVELPGQELGKRLIALLDEPAPFSVKHERAV